MLFVQTGQRNKEAIIEVFLLVFFYQGSGSAEGRITRIKAFDFFDPKLGKADIFRTFQRA